MTLLEFLGARVPLNNHGQFFFAHNWFEIDFVVCVYIRRRARHAAARARTTGVRVDNGCRYHLVFTAERRKGDAWSVHLRLARGGQLLGSCFSFCRLAAASQPPPFPSRFARATGLSVGPHAYASRTSLSSSLSS